MIKFYLMIWIWLAWVTGKIRVVVKLGFIFFQLTIILLGVIFTFQHLPFSIQHV